MSITLIDQIFIKICTKFEQPWEWVCRKKWKPENNWLGLSYLIASWSYARTLKLSKVTRWTHDDWLIIQVNYTLVSLLTKLGVLWDSRTLRRQCLKSGFSLSICNKYKLTMMIVPQARIKQNFILLHSLTFRINTLFLFYFLTSFDLVVWLFNTIQTSHLATKRVAVSTWVKGIKYNKLYLTGIKRLLSCS